MWDRFFRQRAYIGITRSCMRWYVRKNYLTWVKTTKTPTWCARKLCILVHCISKQQHLGQHRRCLCLSLMRKKPSNVHTDLFMEFRALMYCLAPSSKPIRCVCEKGLESSSEISCTIQNHQSLVWRHNSTKVERTANIRNRNNQVHVTGPMKSINVYI